MIVEYPGHTHFLLCQSNLFLAHYLIETPFDAFVNRADPDQAALIRAALSGSTLFAYGNMII